MMQKTIIDSDFQKYIQANKEIDSGNFDKAWHTLNQINSTDLRNSYYQSAYEASKKIEDKIRKYRVSEECDGTHIRPEKGDSPNPEPGNGNGGDCGIISGIITLIVCTICCSKSYDACCWCVWYDAICSFIEWCPCRKI